ncbi:hypothetical protein JI58_06635 [Marinosulfonomonas sp. PRT-SC04]|nr:hypothetical protein JI58_06635 [Marinosulfonomonas sp. PRT-SC04]
MGADVLKTKTVTQTLKATTAGLLLILASSTAGYAQNTGAIQTKQYNDGGIYEGTFLDGKQHGAGIYRLPNGYEYNGEWVAGEIRGQGVAKFPNGSR